MPSSFYCEVGYRISTQICVLYYVFVGTKTIGDMHEVVPFAYLLTYNYKCQSLLDVSTQL